MASRKLQVEEALVALRSGDQGAWDELFPLVYKELRRIAASFLRNERPNHTLQPTALVHEAYLKLVGGKVVHPESRAHFLGLCANVMREILVDYARARARRKRAGGRGQVSLDDVVLAFEERAIDIVALDDALRTLQVRDKRKSEVVALRFFGGLSVEETAMRLGVSLATVERDWVFARAWLRRELMKGTRHEE
jgi:RNA polymerase sigma-70 factor (ECF subfamily)